MTDFTLSRDFAAPREKIWRAWTDPAALLGWWGPMGFALHHAALDLRPGGLFHYGMRAPDGSPMWGRFVFREIVSPERLVWVNAFSDAAGGVTRHPYAPDWPAEMLASITLAEIPGGTRLHLASSALDASPEETAVFDGNHASLTQGWGGTMDRLEAFLAAPGATTPAVVPYLTVPDAEAAIAFYAAAFGAMLRSSLAAEDGRLMHADLALLGGALYLCDAFPEHGGPAPDAIPPASVALVLPRAADVDAVFAQAVAAGAVAKMPPHDAFWGARFAMLTDPAGHGWMLHAEQPKGHASPAGRRGDRYDGD